MDDGKQAALHQDTGLIDEGKGGKERNRCVDHSSPARIPGLCLGDTGSGVGGDAHGRGDLSEDAEVEDEQVGSQGADAQAL